MKKHRLILAGCFAFIGICGAHSEYVSDAVRATAVRRATTNAVVDRQKSTNVSSRTNNTTTSSTVRNRVATNGAARTPSVIGRNTSDASRTNLNVILRATNANSQTQATPGGATNISARTTSTSADTGAQISSVSSRVATTNTVTREDVLSRDYSKCRQVFFDCMDEFCANKDSQLKRCACSSRINEFDSVKKQLADVEEKMLDFNQRLLTVSMDKEDAAALSVATEGEEAYLGAKDTSKSKKTLDSIAKKLNTRFDSSNFGSNLNVLSWSLDTDAAFDSVDSLMGTSTVAKSGTALFSAALPVCREVAAEVCSASDIKLAESGYSAAVEQDCNTVAKTYKAQADQARAKVLEGNALLDMSRLEAYQNRNSDDILTCRRKMLDMLTNSTVCGSDMGKCLDVTGKYIDPSTGEVFLTPDLVNLTTIDDETFISFLDSKRKFLEPAMDQCQDIAGKVWNSFIDDALAQIKIAQQKKLEEVRQSCTELTAQCLSDASESITNFDARALSTFGISADITANTMCQNVLNSCSAILHDDFYDSDNPSQWTDGMSNIIANNSYDTLMQTCRQVGRACIIQVCTSTSGNFGLCESISNSTNRKSIINHTACWDEVKECVASAGVTQIQNFIARLGVTDNFYSKIYKLYDSSSSDFIITSSNGNNANTNSCIIASGENNCIFDLCSNECANIQNIASTPAGADNETKERYFNCRVCRLAESIWGNCEVDPTTKLERTVSHNKIKTPIDVDNPTLLYWFAINTGTVNAADSCRDTTCGIGYTPQLNEFGLVDCIKTTN